jgi:hypothetical protein
MCIKKDDIEALDPNDDKNLIPSYQEMFYAMTAIKSK